MPNFADIPLRVASVVPATEAEGPGTRFALWFQGCPLRCPGCCNPEYLPFEGGEARTVGDILALLDEARGETGVEGITLLGGAPFAHAADTRRGGTSPRSSPSERIIRPTVRFVSTLLAEDILPITTAVDPNHWNWDRHLSADGRRGCR